MTSIQRNTVFSGCNVTLLEGGYSVDQFLNDTAEMRSSHLKHGPFLVVDLGQIVRKYREEWSTVLPDVRPFYAVKCNNDPTIIGILARLGSGFDCASKKEIKQVVAVIGPDQAADRIIFANVYKKPSHIRYAAEVGVELMTFDNESELRKIKEFHPTAKLLLRLKPIDHSNKDNEEQAQKVGAEPRSVERLLIFSSQLGVNVVGVSFHVGLRCFDTSVYRDTIQAAGEVFELAEKYGFHFNLLDIGGGFLGDKEPRVPLSEIASVLQATLDTHFSRYRERLRVIAEPGQFFAMTAFTVAANVIGVCDSPAMTDGQPDDQSERQDVYVLSDGIFGSLGHFKGWMQPKPRPLLTSGRRQQQQQLRVATLRGPTCYGLDIITSNCQLPQLQVGDWIAFDESGAYSVVLANGFNGMSKAKRFYFMEDKYASEIIGDLNEIGE